jgi:flagellar biosynthesis/type III secretory pathway protein FliH
MNNKNKIEIEKKESKNEDIKKEIYSEAKIKNYEYQNIKKYEKSNDSIVSNYNSSFSGDLNLSQSKKFTLNSLVLDPNSIEEEEKKKIQEKVLEKVSLMQEEAKSLGRSLGYEEGQKKGYIDAFEKTREDLSGSIQQFINILDSLENSKISVFQYNEKFLINLIFQISRQIFLKELNTDQEYLIRLIHEMLKKIETKDHIIIKINSEDFHFIEKLENSIHLKFKSLKNFKIEFSSDLPQGSCKVETDWNMIESSYEHQLQDIYNSFMKKMNNSKFIDSSTSV